MPSLDPSAVRGTDHSRSGWKPTILAELGRLSDDPEVIEAFALELCKAKLSTTEAVARLRNIRLSKRSAKRRSPKPLAECILASVQSYQRRHPDTTDEAVLDALNEAIAAFEAAMMEEDDSDA